MIATYIVDYENGAPGQLKTSGNRADNCVFIIRYKAFRMNKPRCVLENAHAATDQLLIIRLCQQINQLFIRYSRCYNPALVTPLSG